ncbi:MAG: methionyl-tRNA formyltransferase [Phycisphaerales bacterium]|nr:methionyl-tRNA formyltransferase [Phycisphaerales bacterium]
MRIAFLGAGAFGIPTLDMLRQRHTLVAVITQPDKPSGRGKVLTPTDVAQWAAISAPDVPVFKPANINEPSEIESIRALVGPGRVDAWVIIAFGQKLSPELLDGLWAINLHGSLLPRWRGAGPVQAAVLAGDAETGNSVITIAQRMDAGLILGQSKRPLEPHITSGDLHDLLSADGPALVQTVLERHAVNADVAIVQDESLVTRARKLSKADSWVEFTDTAEACRRRINGLSPWPGVSVTFRGEPLKLLRSTTMLDDIPAGAMEQVEAHRRVPRPAGQIIAGATGLIACTGGTVLRLCDVQAPGKRAMKWSEFANGAKIAGFPTDDDQFRLIGGRPAPATTQTP